MPSVRRKAPTSAASRKPSKATGVSAKKPKLAPSRKPSKAPAVRVKKPKVAPAKKPVAPKAPSAPVRPLMKLGREDLAAFRWAGRRRGVPLGRPAAPATGLDAAAVFARVAVRDGHASPLAPLRPDGKVATGLRGTHYVPLAPVSPDGIVPVRPAAAPAPYQASPYQDAKDTPRRVTSWRKWP